ncbi:MFS general substrate transporter [Ganoderma sinense ZZ0214-1]|uniref:MFS general substrate transporter n=1 Tax=Ganoderma sinense ZZ0214-1 TaxID=1077348 RepID=A0A2G8RZB1_9APHY|nr:MFS general substrate transporter [Ganoderma sinense ZZ0214-1]
MDDSKRPVAAVANPVLDNMASSKEQGDTAHVEEAGPEDCPDGGLSAWLVVLGAFCGLCATVGLVNAWGNGTNLQTFQAYYQEVELSHRSSSDM